MDAGNLFFGFDNISSSEQILKKETARLIIGVYNDLNYNVYNVGGHDFALGMDFIRELQSKAKFPFISVNIIDSTTGKPYFEPYKIVKAGNKKFGIIGVTSLWNENYRNLKITDPVEGLLKYLPTVRKSSDYVIVLGALNANDEKNINSLKDRFDFLLLAGSYRYTRSLDVTNDKFTARCGTIGKYIGAITAEISRPEKPLQDISNINIQQEYAANRLESFQQNAGVKSIDEYYSDKPNLAKIIHDLQNTREELNQKKSQIVNPLNFELIGLDESIKDDPVIRKKLNEFQKQMKSRGFEVKSAQ
ncbi:MAG: hypothetical protein V1681_03420 [Candidatus Neomarinimicrobiota bacterium]